MSTLHTRRYDLDWLRIIAFGLLIFYHVGMFYAGPFQTLQVIAPILMKCPLLFPKIAAHWILTELMITLPWKIVMD